MTSGAFEQPATMPPRQSTRSKLVWGVGLLLFVAVNVGVILSLVGNDRQPQPVRLVDAEGQAVGVPAGAAADAEPSKSPVASSANVTNQRPTPAAHSTDWHLTWWLGGVGVCIGVVAIGASVSRRRAFEADPVGETLLLAGRKLGLARGEVKAIERLAGEPGRALGLIVSTPALTRAVAERGRASGSTSEERALMRACEKLGVGSLPGRLTQ